MRLIHGSNARRDMLLDQSGQRVALARDGLAANDPKRTLGVLFASTLFFGFLTLASAEQGSSFEQMSPITPTAWISISMPGLAKLVTVINALPG